MKVFVHRSSGWTRDGEVREYEDLETCVKTCPITAENRDTSMCPECYNDDFD